MNLYKALIAIPTVHYEFIGGINLIGLQRWDTTRIKEFEFERETDELALLHLRESILPSIHQDPERPDAQPHLMKFLCVGRVVPFC